MSLTADDFAEYLRSSDEVDDRPLGTALSDLSIDVDVNAVDAVREIREAE